MSIATLLPGSARIEAQEALHVDVNGKVGVGTETPAANLDVRANVVAPTSPMLLVSNAAGPPRIEQTNAAGGHTWRQTVTGQGTYNVDDILDGVIELVLAQNGNLTISGNVITTNCPSGCGPDYVFDGDYELMPLDELESFVAVNRHLPNVPAASEMQERGIDMTQLQLQMLEKIKELVLYTLEQHRTLSAQRETLESQRLALETQRGEMDELRRRLDALDPEGTIH